MPLYVTSTVHVAACWPWLITSTPAMNPSLLSPVTMYRADSRTTATVGVGERVGRGDDFARFDGDNDGEADGDNDANNDGDREGDGDTVITIRGSAATDVACFCAGRPIPNAPITTAHTTAPATARTRTDQNDGVVPARCFATGAETTANDQATPRGLGP